MLDLSGRPPATHTLPVHATAPATGGKPSFADLRVFTAARTDLSANTKARYLSAIDRVAEMQNRPLGAIDADLESLAARYPLDGLDLDHWDTEGAYQTFRRRVPTLMTDAARAAGI